jgi:hypothetical protein
MIVVSSQDLRRAPRRDFRVPVEIVDHHRGRRLVGRTVEVSPFGMFIETEQRFEGGQLVTVKFPSPNHEYDLCLTGEVVRNDDDEGEGGGVAVEFFGVDAWVRSELAAYVAAGHRRPTLTLAPPPL